jgi:hypothetical protein
VSGELGHPAAAARWTEAAPFAGKGDQDPVATLVAAEAREAACQDAARKKFAKLPLDEHGQAIAVVACFRLREEGLKVLAEDPMQHVVLGTPRRVRPCCAPFVSATAGEDRIASRLHSWTSRAWGPCRRKRARLNGSCVARSDGDWTAGP